MSRDPSREPLPRPPTPRREDSESRVPAMWAAFERARSGGAIGGPTGLAG